MDHFKNVCLFKQHQILIKKEVFVHFSEEHISKILQVLIEEKNKTFFKKEEKLK